MVDQCLATQVIPPSCKLLIKELQHIYNSLHLILSVAVVSLLHHGGVEIRTFGIPVITLKLDCRESH